MLAPQAQIAAEGREAREARQRLRGSVDRAVERIPLNGCHKEDDEPEADSDQACEAPRIGATEAEIVEHISRVAGDTWPQARGDCCRERREDEERYCDRDADERKRDPPTRAVVAKLEREHAERGHRHDAEEKRDTG